MDANAETLVAAGDFSKTLARAADDARDWLLSAAAPLWSTAGRTKSRLFPECMNLSARPDSSYFRTFVQARHIFSFVTIGALGWTGPWRDLVSETVDTLIRRAKRHDGFYVHSLDADARPMDDRADLYDQAFVLLALGTAGGALECPEWFDEAEALVDRLESRWVHRLGGYHEGEIADARIRRQNPHMHLFEAFLALYEASGRRRFLDLAERIAELARTSFIESETGALLEYFGDDLTPAAGIEGKIVEPGHCFEWAWLFERMASNGWNDGEHLSDCLSEFARKHGLDEKRGVAINEVLNSGAIQDAKARLWPQTERLKAAVVRYRRRNSVVEAEEATAAIAGLGKYLKVPVAGLWRDKLLADGNWVEEPAPGSSLYHITCAFAELAKVEH